MGTTNKCIGYKSLPNVLFSSKLNRSSSLYKSKSLSSCFKFIQDTKINVIQKNKSHPTIGELLGDDDVFHNQYHKYYSSSKSKRKQYYYHHRSSIHVHYNHRKPRRSQHFKSMKQFQHSSLEPITNTNQFYLYPTSYNYTPLSTYCYYCQSNMYPYRISDYYGGLYQ